MRSDIPDESVKRPRRPAASAANRKAPSAASRKPRTVKSGTTSAKAGRSADDVRSGKSGNGKSAPSKKPVPKREPTVRQTGQARVNDRASADKGRRPDPVKSAAAKKTIPGSAGKANKNRPAQAKAPKKTVKKKTPKKKQPKNAGRGNNGSVLLARAILFGVIFVLFSVLSVLIISAGLHSGGASPHKSGIAYYIGAEKKEDADKYSLKASVAWVGDNKYIRLDDLNDLCKFSVTGDEHELRYITREIKGQSIRFVLGEKTAYVNDILVRMPAKSILKKDGLYVPLDFVKAYVYGLAVEENKSGTEVIIYRTDVKVNGTKKTVASDIIFALGNSDPMTKISKDEEGLDLFIKEPKTEKSINKDIDKDKDSDKDDKDREDKDDKSDDSGAEDEDQREDQDND
ncbi:MAG: hypothetical protein IJT91_09240 [Clostridia bacterium]|nr:hypothetical protein [Clostridia bacterium]